MKSDLQVFTSPQKSFIFCDYAWQQIDSISSQSVVSDTSINFQRHNKVYLWECGSFTGNTLLNAYLSHGERFTDYIEPGSSSFILYDEQKEIIIAARDFMGNYPLYYYTDPSEKGQFIFSFSINSLLTSGLIKPSVNYAKVVEYIESDLHARPNNHTFYLHLYRLLPAYLIQIQHGQPKTLRRYRKFDLSKYNSFTDEAFITRFQELFIQSIHKHTDGHQKIAASLSGGLDSSSICSVTQSLRTTPIHTYNFKPQTAEAQEDEYITAMVDKWAIRHQTIQSTYSGYESIKEIIRQNGQPFFVLNHTIQLDLIEAAKREGCTLFLSGHWGDQVVGYGTDYLDELALNKDWGKLKKAIEQHFQHSFHNGQSTETAPSKRNAKSRRLYAIRLLGRQVKPDRNWTSLAQALWVSYSVFGCSVADFWAIIRQRLNRKKRIFPPKVETLFHPVLLSERERILQAFPAETLSLNEAVNGPLTIPQTRQLATIFKGNQTYGQEEYFEVYRQNSLRSAHPFFDAALLELNLSVPLRLKFDEGRKRGTLRKALKDYLPEKIANRTTKGIFTNHYLDLFKGLLKEFDEKIPVDHPIWKLINREVYSEKATILVDDRHPHADSRPLIMPSVIRVMQVAIWLDYFEGLNKNPLPEP